VVLLELARQPLKQRVISARVRDALVARVCSSVDGVGARRSKAVVSAVESRVTSMVERALRAVAKLVHS
jgi:hypothetical protein